MHSRGLARQLHAHARALVPRTPTSASLLTRRWHSKMHARVAPCAQTTLASEDVPCCTGRCTLLLDIMDTVVVDPFFEHMPKYFGLTFDELMKAKHPSAWLEFEKDEIEEAELFRKFFKDGREFDGTGLRQLMVDSYRYLDGMEDLLGRLKAAGVPMHAMSNYPMWFRHIEDKLKISRYVDWTFVSCDGPMRGLRKPAREAYEAAAAHLQVPHGELILVDDRLVNVDGAKAAGLDGIHFKSSADLEQQLRQRGLQF